MVFVAMTFLFPRPIEMARRIGGHMLALALDLAFVL
jgi:hypothetical protein